jgi:hypothetical protein
MTCIAWGLLSVTCLWPIGDSFPELIQGVVAMTAVRVGGSAVSVEVAMAVAAKRYQPLCLSWTAALPRRRWQDVNVRKHQSWAAVRCWIAVLTTLCGKGRRPQPWQRFACLPILDTWRQKVWKSHTWRVSRVFHRKFLKEKWSWIVLVRNFEHSLWRVKQTISERFDLLEWSPTCCSAWWEVPLSYFAMDPGKSMWNRRQGRCKASCAVNLHRCWSGKRERERERERESFSALPISSKLGKCFIQLICFCDFEQWEGKQPFEDNMYGMYNMFFGTERVVICLSDKQSYSLALIKLSALLDPCTGEQC